MASFGAKAPGTTPLHLAAAGGHLDVMDELLECGANIEARTKGGCGCSRPHLASKVFFACPSVDSASLRAGQAKTLDGCIGSLTLPRLPCTGTPLHVAAKERNKRAVRYLVENGAFLPPDMTDGRFNPPLHYCPGLEWAYKLKRKVMGIER